MMHGEESVNCKVFAAYVGNSDGKYKYVLVTNLGLEDSIKMYFGDQDLNYIALNIDGAFIQYEVILNPLLIENYVDKTDIIATLDDIKNLVTIYIRKPLSNLDQFEYFQGSILIKGQLDFVYTEWHTFDIYDKQVMTFEVPENFKVCVIAFERSLNVKRVRLELVGDRPKCCAGIYEMRRNRSKSMIRVLHGSETDCLRNLVLAR
jgi:hypothetical protein